MKRLFISLPSSLSLFVLTFAVRALHANDTAVTVAAGGLQFAKNAAIEMRKEHLKISLRAPFEIEVSYEFFNTSDRDIDLEVGFPLPLVGYEHDGAERVDEFYRVYKRLHPKFSDVAAYGSLGQDFAESPAAFSDFEVKSDGNRLGYILKYQAIGTDGRDLTEKLEKEGLPLSSLFLNGWEEQGALSLNKDWQRKLESMGLLDAKMERAKWANQITYVWRDRFPARKIHRVSHRYHALPGSMWIKSETTVKSLEDLSIAEGLWKWKDYCPSKALREKILATAQKPKNKRRAMLGEPWPRAREVRYVLKTGANWAGPIRDFELEVVAPDKGSLFSFCFPGAPEIKAANLHENVQLRRKDFVPLDDLRFLILDPLAQFEAL